MHQEGRRRACCSSPSGGSRRLLPIPLLILVALGTLASPAGAQEHIVPGRLSLAISGGASKGAYEAGLNWAILKLVGHADGVTALSGGRLRPLELASVAGASAGGVNTILSGLAWCARAADEGGIADRIDDNVFRDIWLRVDINELMPPQADSSSYLPDDAAFSRKDYFAAADDLRKKWNQDAFRSGCRVPLGVTVTRVDPQVLVVDGIEVKNQRFYIPFELRVEEDGSVGYYFDPADYPGLADPAMILMPRPRADPEFSISDGRVIDAAATTSAFPTAFGRRLLQYCRLALHSIPASTETDDKASDEDLICPEGYVLDEAQFADGGLFDNLPIGLARMLAEESIEARNKSTPVRYGYLDPNRTRYEAPAPPDRSACASDAPPPACKILDFSFFSEARLLSGALGTARAYELYREITSEEWRLNLSQLGNQLADKLEKQNPAFDCRSELPFFGQPLECPEAIRRTGNLLTIAYSRIDPLILPPFSYQRLEESGIATDCQQPSPAFAQKFCRIDIKRYRRTLADALMNIMEKSGIDDRQLYVSISRSRQSIQDDRVLRVTSRGAPITGTLLSDFGSFLDYKFREYDYYVGVYDAVVVMIDLQCGLQYSGDEQRDEFNACIDSLGLDFYGIAGIAADPKARYVFARLAEREFGKNKLLSFSYAPAPESDRDMQIIHDGLEKALEAGEQQEDGGNVFATEDTFFEFLSEEKFVPTPTASGETPLLAEIMKDPNKWPTEMVRRLTSRLVYLESQAAEIYAEREPNPDKRESSYAALMGANAFLLQSSTYKNPTFTFAPSTAPDEWFWRYVIPYEVDFDMVEGDLLFTWQPTLALSDNNLLAVRASLGFAGGLFESSSSRERENYLGLGLGYIRRTGSVMISSFGITPTWYHNWREPDIGDQDTFGGDVNVSFLADRLRVGVGSRDFSNFNDAWFLTVGFTDLPGAIYWLTR